MSSALLLILLVCNRKIGTQISREIQQHVVYFDRSAVKDFSDGNQTVRPTSKKQLMASHYAKTTCTVFSISFNTLRFKEHFAQTPGINLIFKRFAMDTPCY
jgi:hypothetical protein